MIQAEAMRRLQTSLEGVQWPAALRCSKAARPLACPRLLLLLFPVENSCAPFSLRLISLLGVWRDLKSQYLAECKFNPILAATSKTTDSESERKRLN